MSIPLDPDGFIRRECPACIRQFKWFSGQTDGRPQDFVEPENYFCPYCGVSADHDSWWTQEQLDYARQVAAGPVMEHVTDQLQQAFKSASRSSGIRFSASPIRSTEQPPAPLSEPSDMMMVEPPCHPFEPLKIEEEWDQPIHCLMCGERFVI